MRSAWGRRCSPQLLEGVTAVAGMPAPPCSLYSLGKEEQPQTAGRGGRASIALAHSAVRAHFAREREEEALIARAIGAERPRAEIPHGVVVRWRGLLSRRGDQLLREAWAEAHGMEVATTCAFSHGVRSDLPHCGV